MATLIWATEWHATNARRLSSFHHFLVLGPPVLEPNFDLSKEAETLALETSNSQKQTWTIHTIFPMKSNACKLKLVCGATRVREREREKQFVTRPSRYQVIRQSVSHSVTRLVTATAVAKQLNKFVKVMQQELRFILDNHVMWMMREFSAR